MSHLKFRLNHWLREADGPQASEMVIMNDLLALITRTVKNDIVDIDFFFYFLGGIVREVLPLGKLNTVNERKGGMNESDGLSA